jgi:hypothetical protein
MRASNGVEDAGMAVWREEIVRKALFVVLVVLACVEKVGAVAGTVAVERDWVSWGILCLVTVTT